MLIFTAVLVPTSFLAGWLSDKFGRRKVFVWTSTALFAIGTFGLIFVQDVTSFYVLEAFLGVAWGIYVGVDLALVVDVLPNPDDSGKDLGVFNIANALPQTLAPVIGGILVYIGDPPAAITDCGSRSVRSPRSSEPSSSSRSRRSDSSDGAGRRITRHRHL